MRKLSTINERGAMSSSSFCRFLSPVVVSAVIVSYRDDDDDDELC